MTPTAAASEPRLLVIADLERLGPIVRKCFAPVPIIGVRGYLSAIAEIPQAPTRAILVGFDPNCRKPDAAIAAMRAVARDIPLVLCGDPAYEPACRRLVAQGADDYVIFPPEPADLERALGLPSTQTQRCWIETPVVAPVPSAEELARLADVLPRLTMGDSSALDAMAALICAALNAETATVVLEGRSGRAGRGPGTRFDAVLIDPITDGDQRVGQIRVGRSRAGGFTPEDTTKLRHYAVLFGRLVAGARRADEWRRLATTDELTGLANRRRLIEFLGGETCRGGQGALQRHGTVLRHRRLQTLQRCIRS